MMRSSLLKYLVPGLLFLLTGYLLWPLKSNHWDIQSNKGRLQSKTEWLRRHSRVHHPDKPNILFIMVDDLGKADLKLYDMSGQSTPIIESLAEDGVMFENALVTSPMCSPSRASIITGRYAQRFGFEYQMHDRYLKNRLEYLAFKYVMKSDPWHPKWMTGVPDREAIFNQGLPPDEIILPEMLQKHGYSTGLIGKWHLGWSEDNKPCSFGFDYQYGFFQSHTLYAYEGTPGIVDQRVPEDFTDKHIWKGQREGPYAIYRNCREIEERGYLTDRIADEGMAFMDQHRTAPFFLWLSFNAPHTPLQAREVYYQRFAHIDDPVKRVYAAMIANLDDAVGRVLDHIKRLELEENTIIFFISDNGGAEYTYTTDNGPYKGGKITDFEGGIQVPFIMKWKNHFPEGMTYEPMVSSMDIFHSVVHAAQIQIPDDRSYDGVSLLPYLTGRKEGDPHDILFWQRGFSKAVRTNHWKLLLNEDSGDTLLYDMTMDPVEREDVSELHPVISGELLEKHAQWSSELANPLWPSMVNYHFRDGETLHYFDQ
jgi:arylsulfatase A-like enzyme